MSSDDDNDLISRYLAGDPKAMEVLIERYRKRLFGFVYRMVSSQADADDIFQDVWVKVMSKLEHYKPDNFSAWLMTLTRNTVIDRVRSQKPTMSMDDTVGNGQALVDQIPSPVANPVDQAAVRELGARIEAAVRDLPLEQRDVFLMRTQMELGFKEIASIQGVSINTALARMQYALDKLKKVLQPDYDLLGRVG